MGSQKLFTFIMDWNGGTYVSQLLGSSLDNSITTWVNSLYTELLIIQPKDKANLVSDVKNENPVALEGIKNTWCICPNIKGKVATVNIVETVLKQGN